MKRNARRLLWKAAMAVGIPVFLVGGGYGWLVTAKLRGTLEESQVGAYRAHYSLVVPERSSVETSLPRVLRALVKRRDQPNWLPGPDGDLVFGTYDWSPGNFQWTRAPDDPGALREAIELQRFAVYPPGDLIDELTNADPHVREVANALLVFHTGEDFGYRYDRPPESQQKAIEAWRGWWKEHRISWSTKKALEWTEEILEHTRDA
jgi:hypothetical protein